MCVTINRHLSFFHRLEQSGLCLWRCAIDFVSKQDVGEDRTTPQIESGVRDIENVCAGNVRRHEIGRELNSTKAGVDDARECFDSQRLGCTRNTFDERVAFREQSDQDLFDRVVLADDDFCQFVFDVSNSGENDFGHSFSC